MNKKQKKLINKYFYYKDNYQNKFTWIKWFNKIEQNNYTKKILLNSFLEIENRKKQNTFWLFWITTKINTIFWEKNNLNNVFVLENYSFPFKRKSLASYYMFLSKEESNIFAIKYFAKNLYNKFLKLNNFYNFEYIWFLESSNKEREVQIMDYIKQYFLEKINSNKNLSTEDFNPLKNKIKLLEISKQNTYLEQKKISDISGRIKNACESFKVWDIEKQNSNILLIDDVIDSWATINAIAKKIRDKSDVNKIIWLAWIWSLTWKIKINDI